MTYPDGTRWVFAGSVDLEAYRIHDGKLWYSDNPQWSTRAIEDVDADHNLIRIDVPPKVPPPCQHCLRYIAALADIIAESGGCVYETQTEPRELDCQCSPCVAARALKGDGQ